MNKPKSKQIKISVELKKFLDKNKIIPRETYDNVIKRMIKFKEEKCKKR